MGNIQQELKPRKKSSKKYSVESRTDERVPFSFSAAGEDMLNAVIDEVTAKNGAIMFLKSRDGGAGGIRVYHDDVDTKTQWFGDYDELLNELEKLRGLLALLP